MNKILLGVNGWAGAGKDTFADILVERYGFVKIAFADPLREIAAAINPIVTFRVYSQQGMKEEIVPLRYNDVLAEFGYNEAKSMFDGEIRGLLQRIGTEAGRKIIKDSLWVDMAMERADQHERVVIADMRFKNEAYAIEKFEGYTIRILRPGVGPANDHISEHDLDSHVFDTIIENNGDLDDLAVKAEEMMAWG